MNGKGITIAWIIFFGLTASISYVDKDSFYSGVILTIPFVYYVVKFFVKFR